MSHSAPLIALESGCGTEVLQLALELEMQEVQNHPIAQRSRLSDYLPLREYRRLMEWVGMDQ